MEIYLSILNILLEVYAGKNLNDVLIRYNNQDNFPKIKNITYGILRNYFSINYSIDKLVKHSNLQSRILLQIGIFELKYSKKPEYAVINDLVNFSFDLTDNEKIKNFINGVLREYLRQVEILDLDIQKDYSLKYNIPDWIITKLKKQSKENYLQFLNGFNHHPAFGLRVNKRKINQDEYLLKLDEVNLEYKLIQNKICLVKPINITGLPFFNDGFISIQDIAAQSSIEILTKYQIQPKYVLDACAAPGGKTCQLLENINCEVVALDIDETRLNKVSDNLKRLNLEAELKLGNAMNKLWWNKKLFDLIIADVPCSASGTLKRNPDIKINRHENDIVNFVETQRNIVINLWDMLDTNGFMLYITCSIFKEENQDNIEWFKSNLNDFELIEQFQIIPTEYNDSLFYALIKKR